MTTEPPEPTQKAADEFHMAMGYCIAEWARVEDELFRIFQAVLRCPRDQAAIVYSRTSSLEARISLTDELIKLILPKHKSGQHPHEDLAFWDEILKAIRDLLRTRNRIAHHPVELKRAAFYLDVSFMDVPLESWFQIYESQHEQLRRRQAKLPLTINDLTTHQLRTNANGVALRKFYYERLMQHVSEPPQQ